MFYVYLIDFYGQYALTLIIEDDPAVEKRGRKSCAVRGEISAPGRRLSAASNDYRFQCTDNC